MIFWLPLRNCKLKSARQPARCAIGMRRADYCCKTCTGRALVTSKQVHRNVYQHRARVALGRNIDGARASVEQFTSVFDRNAFEAKLEFEFAENEALFGLGSHEEGNGNLRGDYVQLYQQNMKAVVPHLVSTKGYGILLDCGSLMTFHDDAQGSYFWADVVDELDYYFIFGRTFDGVTRRYYELTGPVPLPPKWAFGYAQSKERYFNAREMIAVVEEYGQQENPPGSDRARLEIVAKRRPR